MNKTIETIKVLEEFADEQIQQKKEVQRQLDEIKLQYEKLQECVQSFLQILKIQEESDSGRVFHPTTISSCRAYDLERINTLLNQMDGLSK